MYGLYAPNDAILEQPGYDITHCRVVRSRCVSLVATSLVASLAALLCTGSRVQRALAVFVAALATLAPVFVPGWPIVRFVAGIAAVAGLARTLEMSWEIPSRPALARLLQVLIVFDVRTMKRVEPRMPLRELAIAAALFLLVISCVPAALRVRAYGMPGALLVSWLIGATGVWAFAESASRFVMATFALIGWQPAPLHDHPLASRSLTELWGSRWNLTVTRWLRAHVFIPLARRHHAALGVAAAFVISALFHAYIAGAAGNRWLALMMGAFFVVQGVLVVLERALHVQRWPYAAARVWFFAAILIPSPLFVEPVIKIIS